MLSVEEDMIRHRAVLGLLAIATLVGLLAKPAIGDATEESSSGRIAALAHGSPMLTVAEGLFLIGTARTTQTSFSLEFPYDDTEQPQRRVWLDRFDIDRD